MRLPIKLFGPAIGALSLVAVGCGSSDATTATSASSSVATSSSSSGAGGAGGSGAGGASSSSSTGGGSSSSTGTGGASAMLKPCPTSGKGGIVAPASCFVFTPADAGASAAGVNATQTEYALEPAGAAQGALVVQLNGSKGSPAGQISDPQQNYYNAAAGAGFHVIGLAYRSDDIIGQLCNGKPDCFGPTRQTIVLGKLEKGAAMSLSNMQLDEGIVARIDAALRLLSKDSPQGGWEQFLVGSDADPSKNVAWSKLIASGHSQGGGHAAFLGQTFALRRVVQLSSTCDQTSGTPAPWTDASAMWSTSPKTAFVGFAAPTTFNGSTPSGGDTTCPYHYAVWQNMGMDPSNMHDDAQTCGMGNTHGASIGCTDNFPRWAGLLQ